MLQIECDVCKYPLALICKQCFTLKTKFKESGISSKHTPENELTARSENCTENSTYDKRNINDKESQENIQIIKQVKEENTEKIKDENIDDRIEIHGINDTVRSYNEIESSSA